MDRKVECQRVMMGVGAFHHPPRAKYSEETKSLVKLLMDESKLTMMQRRSIQAAVDRGDSLPVPKLEAKRFRKSHSADARASMPIYSKKRSQEMIIKSGAYEREQFRRTTPLTSKEKQKRHLACIMAYGKDMPETPRGPRILHKSRKELPTLNDDEVIKNAVDGIRERMEFLNDMENLGLGKKYRPIMQQEIAEKIRLIESLEKQKSLEFPEDIKIFQFEKSAPKPYPMGDLDVN